MRVPPALPDRAGDLCRTDTGVAGMAVGSVRGVSFRRRSDRREGMTSSSVGLGVVGLGFMGRRYARFIAGIEGIHLAGVCDVNEGLAKEVAGEHGCAVYGDPAALAAADVAGV